MAQPSLWRRRPDQQRTESGQPPKRIGPNLAFVKTLLDDVVTLHLDASNRLVDSNQIVVGYALTAPTGYTTKLNRDFFLKVTTR